MDTKSISKLLDQTVRTKVFGVDYHHLSLAGGDDLYVTEYGLPFIENLLPENFWTDNQGRETSPAKNTNSCEGVFQ